MKDVLERRLIKFSVSCIKIRSRLDTSYASNHLYQQLVRSATSVSLNYAEANGSESRKDFVHKLSIVLKELRESQVNFKMMKLAELTREYELINNLIQESDELISIFVKSISTLRRTSISKHQS